MSRKSALNDPYVKMLNEEALTLLDRILEHIQRGMVQEPVKTSVADYLRVLDTRLELLERLRADEPRTLEISYIPPIGRTKISTRTKNCGRPPNIRLTLTLDVYIKDAWVERRTGCTARSISSS